MDARRTSSRLFLALAISLVLGAGALLGRGLDNELKAHMRDVKSLNLINGLTLQVEQMRGLCDLARRAGALEAQVESAVQENRDALVAAVVALKAALRKGEFADEEMRRRVHQAKGPMKHTHVKGIEGRQMLVQQALELLTEPQKGIVRSFHACIIAKVDLTNPSLIGSASGNVKGVRKLERLREIPPHRYERMKARLCQRWAGRMRHKFPGEVNPEEEAAAMAQFVDRIRAMEDLDWQLRKTDMVKEFEEMRKPKRGRRGKDPERRVKRFVGRFLLNSAMVPVYEERVAAGGAPEPSKVPESFKGLDPNKGRFRMSRRRRRRKRRWWRDDPVEPVQASFTGAP